MKVGEVYFTIIMQHLVRPVLDFSGAVLVSVFSKQVLQVQQMNPGFIWIHISSLDFLVTEKIEI